MNAVIGLVTLKALLEAKRTAGRRERYLTGLRAYLRSFLRVHPNIAVVSVDDLDAFLDARGGTGSTRASNIGRLSALFRFAKRRGLIPRNPCDDLERPRVCLKTPQILTVEQCEEVLAFCSTRRSEMLAWLALALFAGLRPEEAEVSRWESVNLVKGTVTVDASTSKTHRRRIVHLMPAAAAWLGFAADAGARLPVPASTRRRFIRQLREVLGLEAWPQDVLRHSCASYWLALERDAGKVAFELGNSPRILMRHYAELVGSDAAAAFWSLRPAVVGEAVAA